MNQTTVFWHKASALTLLMFGVAAHAVGLPDTGQSVCYNDTVADGVAASDPSSISRDGGTHPRQDCRYGRDAAVAAGATTVKAGAGSKGFDYTKVANDGSTLDASAAIGANPTDWACTQDNITGLMWEVKSDSGLRDQLATYSWYSSNATTNGGNAGTASGSGNCSGGSGCDTEKFVADVNSANLCSFGDWRIPTKRELQTLVSLTSYPPSVDSTYFLRTMSGGYWSSTTLVSVPAQAWVIYFTTGGTGSLAKSSFTYLRLVRGGPF